METAYKVSVSLKPVTGYLPAWCSGELPVLAMHYMYVTLRTSTTTIKFNVTYLVFSLFIQEMFKMSRIC